MKKIAIITGLILATSTNLFGQNFGIKAGVNFSRINGPESTYNYDGYESKTEYNLVSGAALGMTFEYEFNDNFGLTTGLGVSQKGTGITYSSSYEYGDQYGNSVTSSEKIDYKLRITYAEIPLMFKGGVNVGNTKFYGMFGGTIGMPMFGNFKLKYTEIEKGVYDGETFNYSETETDSEFIDFSEVGDFMGGLNIGLMPGVGVEIGNIQLEATYNMGINAFDGDGSMNSLSCSVGYKFGKK